MSHEFRYTARAFGSDTKAKPSPAAKFCCR